MNEEQQNIKETTTRSGNTLEKTTEVSNPKSQSEHTQMVAERVVWFIAGVLLVILGLRFVLTLMGANTSNSFANFIYNTSHPFVAPFFSLFNYKHYSYGTSHFEVYTLIAMLVYALIAWGITKLVTLNRE